MDFDGAFLMRAGIILGACLMLGSLGAWAETRLKRRRSASLDGACDPGRRSQPEGKDGVVHPNGPV